MRVIGQKLNSANSTVEDERQFNDGCPLVESTGHHSKQKQTHSFHRGKKTSDKNTMYPFQFKSIYN